MLGERRRGGLGGRRATPRGGECRQLREGPQGAGTRTLDLTDLVEEHQSVERPPDVRQQHRLVEQQLFGTGSVADAIEGDTVGVERVVVKKEAPHQVAGADLDDLDEQLLALGPRRQLGLGEHLVGLRPGAALVERLADQQADLGRRPVHGGGTAEPLHLGEVVAVPGEAGRSHEQLRIRRARRVEPGRGDPDRVLPAARTVRFDAIGVLQQEPPPRQRRHAGAHDLAVQRVGEADPLPPALGAHLEQATSVEQLELAATDHRLERRQPRRLPDRQHVQRFGCRLADSTESGGDQLVQPLRRDELAGQPPRPVPTDELTTLQ